MTIAVGSVVAVLMALTVSAAASVGGDLVGRQRAQVAADAAALAAVQAGAGDARRVAELNGAELVRIDIDGHTAEVVVQYRDYTARARATSEP